jgi:hypothetical protein
MTERLSPDAASEHARRMWLAARIRETIIAAMWEREDLTEDDVAVALLVVQLQIARLLDSDHAKESA